jgi:hypothetical protein
MATDAQYFLDVVEEALEQVIRALGCSDNLDGVLIRVEVIFQCLTWVKPIFSPSTNHSNLMSSLSEMISCIHSSMWDQSILGRGRLTLDIPEHALSSLLELDFTQVEIAEIIGCSTRTVHRRILDFGLSRFTEYTQISDSQLDDLVGDFVSNFPTAGQKTLAGHLSTLGYRIQRFRIRESLHRVDHWEYNKGADDFYIDGNTKLLGQTAYGTSMVTISSFDGA